MIAASPQQQKEHLVSKLAERIRNVTRLQSQPLGFVTARSAAQATMVLAATTQDARAAADLASRGADVVIVGSAGAPARPEAPEGVTAVLGAYVAGVEPDESKRFREAGFDFIIFDPDRAGATALLDETIGYVLRLPEDLTDLEVRALEGFRLDAIDIGAFAAPLTVRRQIGLQRLFALTRKPLMSAVMPDIAPAELQALRDTNVPIVTVDGSDAVATLRAKIDALPPRTRRKDENERMTPFVPHPSGHDEEEDEHDHDDE
jgi:hypothetical protein